MKKTKLFIIAMVVMVLLFQTFVPAYATTSEKRLSTIEQFALATVKKVSSNDTSSTWNNDTVISDSIPLYDIDGVLNGYIYNLTTNGVDNGYIHIFTYNDNFGVVAYCFEGRHYVEKFLQQNVGAKNVQRADNRVIYNGNTDFYVETKEGLLCNVIDLEMIDESSDITMKNQYETIRTNILAESVSKAYFVSNGLPQNSRSATTKYVLNANNLDIVIMDDFSNRQLNGENVSNHCSPTAGTTIVKYWANRRGVSNLYHSSDWWVFSSLCVNMETDFEDGTTSANFLSGLKRYSTSTRGVAYSGSDWWGNRDEETITYSKAVAIIDADVPFHLDLYRHSTACFGYSTVSGGNQLIVSYGWDQRAWTYHSFSTLTIDYYQYVRWN